MPSAAIWTNNDIAALFWRYDAPIADCLGFAIFREENKIPAPNEGHCLPAWVGFQGQNNPSWTESTTAKWPIQKFAWKDLSTERGKSYGYRIVPMIGTADHLVADQARAVTCGPAALTASRGSFDAYFNRGILSTQFVSHQISTGDGDPSSRTLMQRIDQPGDPLRQKLAGQIVEGLMNLLKRADEEGGSCYAALYELTDPELLQRLLEAPSLNIILTNTVPDDKENNPARQALHEKTQNVSIIDRFVSSGHIGHNKFVVYVDADEVPKSVLLGSTNWTDTGVCCQSNNALIVHDATIAQAYYDYWHRLSADTSADGHGPQATALRQSNSDPGANGVLIDGASVSVWYSPNTPHARAARAQAAETCPLDLKQVFTLMEQAEQAILFLVFQPGTPSIVEKAAEVANKKPHLFVRGAATDPKAVDDFSTLLVHRPGDAPVQVVAAAAINDQFDFWQKELLKSSPGAHAIIHDKIVVIDPNTDHSVVITGSHNLGYRASYNNDENMLIVRGHRELAQAYAVHVLDIYDHYRFRIRFTSRKRGHFPASTVRRIGRPSILTPSSRPARTMTCCSGTGSRRNEARWRATYLPNPAASCCGRALY